MSQAALTPEKPQRRVSWTFIIALMALFMSIDWHRLTRRLIMTPDRAITLHKDLDEVWELLKDDKEVEQFKSICFQYEIAKMSNGMPRYNYKSFPILQSTQKQRYFYTTTSDRSLVIHLFEQHDPFLCWIMTVTMDEDTDDIIEFDVHKWERSLPSAKVEKDATASRDQD